MQAWQSVQVTNEESAHRGRAGTVLRLEKVGELEMVQVWLDETPDFPAQSEPFAPTELVIL